MKVFGEKIEKERKKRIIMKNDKSHLAASCCYIVFVIVVGVVVVDVVAGFIFAHTHPHVLQFISRQNIRSRCNCAS